MKIAFGLLFFFVLLSCSNKVSDELLMKCNTEQKACNQQVHDESCGTDNASCIRKMLTDSNWSDDEAFDKKLKSCDEDYQKCLQLKK